MVQKEKKYITWEGLNQHAKNVGKKIKECDTGVIGGYNGSFPLTAATKGNIYLLPATKKYYVCIKNYNGSQLTAPNANFEELSVYTNRSKLDNLFDNYTVYNLNSTDHASLEKSVILSEIHRCNNLVMIFGMIRINNNSPIVDVEVPELLRPKSTITFVTNSVKSMLDKNGSTHTCRLQTDGRIVALGNSHQDNGIFFISYGI